MLLTSCTFEDVRLGFRGGQGWHCTCMLAQAALFVEAGVTKIRLTGGEPTLRKDIVELTSVLSALPGCQVGTIRIPETRTHRVIHILDWDRSAMDMLASTRRAAIVWAQQLTPQLDPAWSCFDLWYKAAVLCGMWPFRDPGLSPDPGVACNLRGVAVRQVCSVRLRPASWCPAGSGHHNEWHRAAAEAAQLAGSR